MATSLALNSALSGLLASQQALNVISNNLANINTPNYSKKTVQLEENVLAGQGAGVQVASITRSVNQALTNSLNTASGTLQSLTSVAQFNTQIQNMFGNVGSGSSIADLMQTLGNSFSDVANNPSGSASEAVEAATNVTNSFQSMSTQVQTLREQSDQQIDQDVGTVNTTLQNIAALNSQISSDTASGTDVSDLEDQRDGELATLSKYMNYTTFTRGDGSISVYTTQGTPLVDGAAQTVNFSPASTIQAQMSLQGGQLSGITVSGPNISGGATDITSQITGGDISGLLTMRDTSLPNIQSQLDTMAQTLQTGLNQINNAGTSYPSGGQSFTGQTTFLDPSSQNISLESGDTAVTLFNGDGSQQGTTTLSLMMKQYMQSTGLPTSNSWTIDQVAGGLNGWINTQLGTSNVTYASVLPTGQFSIQLPQTSSTTIGFRDESTSTYQSQVSTDPNTALGFTGPLTFEDSTGASYSVNVTASDTLSTIQAKLAGVSGITASLVPNSAGSGDFLQVVDNAGNNLYVNPDTQGGNVESGLGMLPAGTNTAGPVTLNVDNDNLSSTFTSNNYTNGASVPGVSGVMTFSDSSGQLAQITMNPAWSLNTIANNINAQSGGKLNASVITVGNQSALQVVDVAGNQMSVNTTPYTVQSTTPFTATAGNSMTATINGVTYTSNVETGSDSLASLASEINDPLGPFSGSGLLATVDPSNSYLSIVSTTGQPASYTGAMATQLGLTTNPATALGLQASPDTTASGFANFLGLNDLLVTNQPLTTYQSATLTNNFSVSKATSLELTDPSFANGDPSSGTPQALNISFAAGSTLAQIAAQINQQAVTYNTSALPTGSFVAQAGTLTIKNQPYTLGSISVSDNESLSDIAASINSNTTLAAAGVQATVGTDGTNQWLQIYNQQGKSLQMAEDMTSGGPQQLDFDTTQLASATVVTDGSGQRLQITHSSNSQLQATGTLLDQTNMGPAALNTSTYLTVRSDIQANPSLMSRGAIQYDSTSNSYYVGSSDSTITQDMANYMSSPLSLPSSGGLSQGNLSLPQYAADMIATASTNASNTNTQLTYQTSLVSNLSNQQGQVSGVNLDQELSDLLTYQQSYSASAKVISTMQQLFQVLDSILQ
ncbi:MAG TPA: flagellar hook-associated protein FlgK [Magnetospirillaceae bacterium]|jgi:flagellar hook-associated protein FlgK